MTTPGTPKPEDVSRINVPQPIGEEAKQPPPGAADFQSYMGAESNPLLTSPQPTQVSPFDLAHGGALPSGSTLTTLMAQTKTAHVALGDVYNQLQTPKLKLKQSSKYILKNKLSSAKSMIRSASAKMGAEMGEEKEVDSRASPIEKFVGLVTDGQIQLELARKQLESLKDKGESLSPADMLQIQIKLNKAQQLIEYSSLLLSKAVDDMKMLMNIQL
ncbi:MAG: hypothetical protein L0207_00140 [Chlamydiae bacterium]|nr:hypothetical protein [Chlamydiota bacterium]